MIQLPTLIDHLQARRSGANWMARCPAHQDHSPSLSIRESNGKILIHCFAGCTIHAICDAIGVRVSDLFSEHRLEPRTTISAAESGALASLRPGLTPRERDVLPVTIISCTVQGIDAAIARALALATEQEEIVQVILE